MQEGGIGPHLDSTVSDPDYRLRNRVRESDLRRHLVNEIGVQEDLIQDDGRPDPRFAASTEELTRQGITDYQLHYALQTISRLGRLQQPPQIAATPGRPRASR